MKKLFLSTVVLAAITITPGLAADLRRPTYKAPPPPPVWSWTGCYIGVNGGYGWRNEDHTNNFTVSVGSALFVSQSTGAEGGFGGGQVGCNYQTGAFVWGIEADIEGSGIKDGFGLTAFPAPPGGHAFTASAEERLKWFGTVRGRLGVALDRVLLYGTGGVAFGKTEYSFFAADPGGNNSTLVADSNKTGYVVGAGIEWAFLNNWTAKVEYQYLNFGTIGSVTAPILTPAGAPTGVFATGDSFRNDYHTIRVGLNYRFGWGYPVTARY